jgi:hypothetical protein
MMCTYLCEALRLDSAHPNPRAAYCFAGSGRSLTVEVFDESVGEPLLDVGDTARQMFA